MSFQQASLIQSLDERISGEKHTHCVQIRQIQDASQGSRQSSQRSSRRYHDPRASGGNGPQGGHQQRSTVFFFLTKNSLILFAKQFLQKLIEFLVAIYFTSVPVSNILPLLWRIDISSEQSLLSPERRLGLGLDFFSGI